MRHIDVLNGSSITCKYFRSKIELKIKFIQFFKIFSKGRMGRFILDNAPNNDKKIVWFARWRVKLSWVPSIYYNIYGSYTHVHTNYAATIKSATVLSLLANCE